MFTVPEDLSTQAKLKIDQTLKFTETSTEAAEQLFDLNLKTIKAAGVDAATQFKALAGAKDVQEFASLQTSFVQANAEKVAGYFRAVYGWGTDTQGELSKLFETQVAEANKTLTAALDKAAKSAPTGSEFAFAAAKSALTAANQAYDAITKAGKQVADITEATIASAPSVSRKKAA